MSNALLYLHWPQTMGHWTVFQVTKMKGHVNNHINTIVYLSYVWNYVSAQVNMPRWAVFLTSAESKSFRHNLLLQNVVKTVEYRIILRKQQKTSLGGGSACFEMSSVAGWDTRIRLRWFSMLLNYFDKHGGGRFLVQYHWLLQFIIQKMIH